MTVLILIGVLFSSVNDAYAHKSKHTHHNQVAKAQTSFHWVLIKGHWAQGHWVKPRWTQQPGPRPYAYHHHMHWISGHYEGRGQNARWVPGHWARI